MFEPGKKEKKQQYEKIFSYLSKKHGFAIIKDLGIGGYGQVKEISYRNYSFALKVQFFKAESKEYFSLIKKNFDKELILSQNMKHKNLVSTFKTLSEKIDKMYISEAYMEKCNKGNLTNLLEHINKGNLFRSFLFYYNVNFPFMYYFSENLCKYLINQLLWGLEYLHQIKVCHFDIKPENIFLANNYTVKIGDFGLARFALQNKEECQDKCKELNKGSFHSMGPEYYENNRIINRKFADKVDIFGVGVILFLLIFKRNLIEKPNDLGMTSQFVRSQIIEGIKSINENKYISKNLKNFLTKTINIDYKMRPNVYELLEDEWINTDKKIINEIKEENYGELDKILLEMQKRDSIFCVKPKPKFKCNNTKNKKIKKKKNC